MKNMHKFGMGFWSGAGVYSIVNMILNIKQVPQQSILNYNYIITGVAIAGLIFNWIMIKKTKEQ